MNKKYDIIVVGGGFAGTCAAISAAKEGQKVLLIEKFNALGGAAVSNLVTPFMPYWTIDTNGNKKYICGDLFLEITEEVRKISKIEKINEFDEEILKLILNRLIKKHGIELLFNTLVTDVTLEKQNIKSIKAFGKSKKLELEANYYIDATGDGELSALAGCDFILGREKDNLCQPMTLCFRMGQVDKEKFQNNRSKINNLYKEFQEKGLIKNPKEDVLAFSYNSDGVIHFNTTRIIKKNPIDPFQITDAEIEAREQMFEILNFLKTNFEGFENARILSSALQIGIRESRKIIGEYILTESDLKSLAKFDDVIAVANYDIDIHNPEGSGTKHYYFNAGEWYQIPYRCLIPKGIKNMLVAGRCISSTHEAQSSYRIMPFCAEIGQAAGIAISLANKNKCDVRKINIKLLQEKLRENGFVI